MNFSSQNRRSSSRTPANVAASGKFLLLSRPRNIGETYKMPISLLSNYLRMYRRRGALTQHELAALLGSSHGAKVSRYERGERVPTLATVMAYEVIFRVGLRQLFAGDYHEVLQQVRRRARRLSREIRSAGSTSAATERKLDLLTRIINDLPTAIL